MAVDRYIYVYEWAVWEAVVIQRLDQTTIATGEWDDVWAAAQKLAESDGIPVVLQGTCFRCETGTAQDYYMVRDEVWAQAAVPEHAELHLHCLEEAIGRRLTIEDFPDQVINRLIRFGYAMGHKRWRCTNCLWDAEMTSASDFHCLECGSELKQG
jgi:hypothetical protein